MKFPPILYFCIFLQALTVKAIDLCEFERPPKSMKRVSANPATPFRIRFILSDSPNVCQLKVKIPSDTLVTFNLTASSGADGELAQTGDKLTSDMYVTNNRKTLMIINVSAKFGSRFGRYQLNQREVYGVPYAESIYRPILEGRCVTREGDGFDMTGKLRTTTNFRRCLRYNEEKGKKEEDYLLCSNCKNLPTLNDDNTMLSFDMENLTELEYMITCRIKTEDDRVNYSLRFIPMQCNVL